MINSDGDLSYEIFDGQVRNITYRGIRVVDRLYFAVRDVHWHVLPTKWCFLSEAREEDEYCNDWQGSVVWGDVVLKIDLNIRITSAGLLRFAVTGETPNGFAYSRLGIFVILPIRGFQGRPIAGAGSANSWRDVLPVLVGPQRVVDGRPFALFPPHRKLDVQLDFGRLTLQFSGDDFEIEDERNWTEMGYKVYAGPFERGWPLVLPPGGKVEQSVEISLEPTARTNSTFQSEHTHPTVTVDAERVWNLPHIGHQATVLGRELDQLEARLLASLRPDFIHVEFRERDPDRLEKLNEGLSQAVSVGASVSVALFVSADVGSLLAELDDAVHKRGVLLVSLLLYVDGGDAEDTERWGTPPELTASAMATIRSRFGSVRVFVGSDLNLAEFNRRPPALNGADGFCIGMSPSGHADESWAIMANLPAQGDALRTLKAFEPTALLCAGPISLQIPEGGGPRPPDATPWPPNVDPRQTSSLAASWTLGSLIELMQAGAEAAIYYETVGWRGLLERVEGSANPFPSKPGQIFPVFDLFRDVLEARDGRVLATRTSDGISALCIERGDEHTLLLANHTAECLMVEVEISDRNGVEQAAEGLELDAYGYGKYRLAS